MVAPIKRAYGPLIVGIESDELSAQDIDNLQHPAVGGVILFTRNYHSHKQLQTLCASIKALRQPELLIAVDQEGGRVQRFKTDFTRLPPLSVYGQMYEDEPDRAADYAYRHGRVMAAELRALGVDLSFAPVLDVLSNSEVIGDRAFSADPQVITLLGRALVAGMHDSGMRTVGKHFPGHGSVLADSHHEVVTDNRELAELQAHDLIPFQQLSGQLDAVMMAHVCYPCIDKQPAGYAKYWIDDILRKQLGFSGVVISDDLDMLGGAAIGDMQARLIASFTGGCQLALVCHPASATSLLAELNNDEHSWPKEGIQAMLPTNKALSLEQMQTVGEWRQWQQSLQILKR